MKAGRVRGLEKVEEAGKEHCPVEVGVVTIPGTHVTDQGREPKPNTGGSRPGGPYRGTTPTSSRGTGSNQSMFVSKRNCEVEEVKVVSASEILWSYPRWRRRR